jgi:hypothetical protein
MFFYLEANSSFVRACFGNWTAKTRKRKKGVLGRPRVKSRTENLGYICLKNIQKYFDKWKS